MKLRERRDHGQDEGGRKRGQDEWGREGGQHRPAATRPSTPPGAQVPGLSARPRVQATAASGTRW
jgi:hypothetical protein